MKPFAIVLAAGQGLRFGEEKQFISIAGKPLFVHTVERFYDSCNIVLAVPAKHDVTEVEYILKKYGFWDVIVICGGSSRSESEWFCLLEMWSRGVLPDTKVLVTDANRPLVSRKTIQCCIDELDTEIAVTTVMKSVNTSCASFNGTHPYAYSVYDRKFMYELLMPQACKFDYLYAAHHQNQLRDVTNDTELLLVRSKMIEIPYWESLKLTYPEDKDVVEFLLKRG
jgi:2-C-methyl-D-erythritol 4-phosphate cytidylyltransferase